MPRLTPVDLIVAGDVLQKAGIISTGVQSQLQEAIVNNGLTIDAAVQTIAHQMFHGENGYLKLKAADAALKLNGCGIEEEQKPQIPQIIFQFKDSNVNLNGIFAPVREKDTD
jgi:hypothetical protein